MLAFDGATTLLLSVKSNVQLKVADARQSLTVAHPCLCVCVFVCDHIFGTARPIYTNFLCVLPMAVARSSSGGVVIRYLLLV